MNGSVWHSKKDGVHTILLNESVALLPPPQCLLGALALGDVLINDLKLLFTVPYYYLAEDLKPADFTILPYDAHFVFGRDIIALFSFFPSDLELGIALRGVSLLYRGCVKFLNAVAAIYFQRHPIGINGLTFCGHDAHPQRGVIQRMAKVLFSPAQRFFRAFALGDVTDNTLDHSVR